jgi:hypothetical protein
MVPFIGDSSIGFEMSIFGAIMNYAVKKRYVPASQRFDERPKLKTRPAEIKNLRTHASDKAGTSHHAEAAEDRAGHRTRHGPGAQSLTL